MKKLLLSTVAALSALASPAALAQQAAPPPTSPPAAAAPLVDADPALWVVKDADTTIYLFGTIHVLKPGLGWFDEGVKAAFDNSDQLVLEMVEPPEAEMSALVMKVAVNPDGPTLTEKLPADTRVKYEKAMSEAGVPVAAFDRMDPWFAGLTLSLLPIMKLGYDPNSGAEAVLTAAATAANKPVSGVETPEQQLGFFDALSQPAQIEYLDATLDAIPRVGTVIDSMVKDWSAGDPDALAATMNEEMRATPEIAKLLLSDRNARWAEWVDTRMDTPGTVFLAVGAGHLAGPESLQAWLAKRDLTATRVAY